MPKRVISIAALVIAAAIGIGGCSVNGSDAAKTSRADSSASAGSSVGDDASKTADPTPDKPAKESPSAPKTERPSGPAVTLAHEDSYKSVYNMTADQVATFTGIEVRSGNLDRIVQTMSETARWKAQKPTAKYADLIATAADRENNSLRRAVRAVIQDPSARVQIYVSHNRYATIAHIGITHNN
ncbi:hypothetical protein [Streptomyces sp. NPDC046821]|uniref:hypothetical protein n=1 Tax=Streptomyces sp. NPDC046821 TaxID=3154702 RepID=UPI0033DA2194